MTPTEELRAIIKAILSLEEISSVFRARCEAMLALLSDSILCEKEPEGWVNALGYSTVEADFGESDRTPLHRLKVRGNE